MRNIIIFGIVLLMLGSLSAVNNLSVNGGESVTVALTDSLHFEFNFEVVGNYAEYEFAIEVLGQQVPLFNGNDDFFADGGTLDETGVDGVFSGGFNNFMQLPADAVLIVTLCDEGVSDAVNISFEQIVSDFSIAGSVFQEGSWMDLPVFPAFVFCTYNASAQVIITLLENFDPELFLEFTNSGHYLLSDITGFLGDYQINIPDEIPNVTCGLGVISMLDDDDTFVAPAPMELAVNGHLTGIDFMYYETDGMFWGIVTNSEAQPVSGAVFLLEIPGGLPYYFTTDGDGNFSIPLMNNSYVYSIIAAGYEFYEGDVTISGSDVYADIVLNESAGQQITVSKDFSDGWNWFSLNVVSEDMSTENVLASLGDSAGYIKNQESFATYYDESGWFGSLTEIDNLDFYKLAVLQTVTWEFTGLPVDPLETIYDLNIGWNWISYSPQIAEETNIALAGLDNNAGYIKNQTRFSTYYDSIGWYGSMTDMEPLAGYMINMTTVAGFNYPLPTGQRKILNNVTDTFDYRQYQYNGSMVITTADGTLDGRIIAYNNGEIRGFSEIIDLSDVFGKEFYTMMVYSNSETEDNYELYYESPDVGYLEKIDFNFTFAADMRAGDFKMPVMIKLPSEDNDVEDIVSTLTAYPNPFNPQTTISFSTTESTDITELIIYNIKGQIVRTLINDILPSGKHSVIWNGFDNNNHSVSSGVYFIRLQTGKEIVNDKVILMK